jgi:hypothetical protein
MSIGGKIDPMKILKQKMLPKVSKNIFLNLKKAVKT